jgi:hypothetical protein
LPGNRPEKVKGQLLDLNSWPLFTLLSHSFAPMGTTGSPEQDTGETLWQKADHCVERTLKYGHNLEFS